MLTRWVTAFTQLAALFALGISQADALARMRAHAYVTDQSLADLAAGIVAGYIRLERA